MHYQRCFCFILCSSQVENTQGSTTTTGMITRIVCREMHLLLVWCVLKITISGSCFSPTLVWKSNKILYTKFFDTEGPDQGMAYSQFFGVPRKICALTHFWRFVPLISLTVPFLSNVSELF